MIFYLFTRFLHNPRLVLTELRTENGGYLSLAAAFLATATAVLSHFLVFGRGGSPVSWLAGSLATLAVLIAFAVFYLPVIHLFAETRMPGSRISDLFIYSGFILSPLFFTLPLALIFMLFPLSWALYSMAMVVILAVIFVNFVRGVNINYHLGAWQSVLAAVLPLLIVLFVPLAVAALSFAA